MWTRNDFCTGSSWLSYIECYLTLMECNSRQSFKYSICIISFNTHSNAISQFTSVQSLSRLRLFATPCMGAQQASLSITNTQQLAQTHVHRVVDAIQPSHPLSSPSPPALNLSQHQGLFQWVSSSHQVAKLLEFQPKYWSFSQCQRMFKLPHNCTHLTH